MAELSAVPDVDIDADGVFKYVLIRVRPPGGAAKDVVRGYGWAEYHGEPGPGGIPGVPSVGGRTRVSPRGPTAQCLSGKAGAASRVGAQRGLPALTPALHSRHLRARGRRAGAARLQVRVPGRRPHRSPQRRAPDPRLRLLGGECGTLLPPPSAGPGSSTWPRCWGWTRTRRLGSGLSWLPRSPGVRGSRELALAGAAPGEACRVTRPGRAVCWLAWGGHCRPGLLFFPAWMAKKGGE